MEIEMIDQELYAFAQGYLEGTKANGGLVQYADDWITWRDYDLNLIGKEYSEQAGEGLYVAAYPAGWRESLPNPLYQFIVGETK
jgi:hypothetical protein